MGAHSINHLLFADDSYIFTHATVKDCKEVMAVLDLYERASGQVVNLQKSIVVFSKNIGKEEQLFLADYLGVQRVDLHDRYRGLSTWVGRNKTGDFSSLRKKLANKLDG